MDTMTMQEKLLSLLSKVDRKGVDKLIEYIKNSDYMTAPHSEAHHNVPHGLMMHSLEVMDAMFGANTARIPNDTIILTALCHDLGKTGPEGKSLEYDECSQRSVDILDMCGVELTEDERHAILKHDLNGMDGFLSTLLSSPLLLLLQIGDVNSIQTNKNGKA